MIVDFFHSQQLDHYIRPILQQKLEAMLSVGNHQDASKALAAFIDSWPIGGSIKMAWDRWNHGCDELALTVLHRAKEIMTIVGAESPDLPLPRPLPPHISMAGDRLIDKRAEICEQALRHEITAVIFTSPVPMTPEAQLALGELRMEAKSQHASERYGLPGLLAPTAPDWDKAFGPAPSGRMGKKLRKMCDLAILPGIPSRMATGDTSPIAWLLWNGPARPLPVANVAAELMRKVHLGCNRAIAEVGLTPQKGQEIIAELVMLGALDRID